MVSSFLVVTFFGFSVSLISGLTGSAGLTISSWTGGWGVVLGWLVTFWVSKWSNSLAAGDLVLWFLDGGCSSNIIPDTLDGVGFFWLCVSKLSSAKYFLNFG